MFAVRSLVVLVLLAVVAPVRAALPEFTQLVKDVGPAVVNISTTQRVRVNNSNPFAGTPFGSLFGNPQGGNGGAQTREAKSLGSGFITPTPATTCP